MGAKYDNFCLFSAYLGVFCPDLWMKYRIFISIVDISANLENIDIDIDNAILKISISISISIRLFCKISISISISIGLFWNISISISVSIRGFWKISISIRGFQKKIDIDIISNRLEFGISNRAKWDTIWDTLLDSSNEQTKRPPVLIKVAPLHWNQEG